MTNKKTKIQINLEQQIVWKYRIYCLCFGAKMFRNFIGGIFFVSFMFLSAFFGSIFMMGPTLPLLLFKPNWFRYTSDKLMGTWLALPVVSIIIISLCISLAYLCCCINLFSYCFNNVVFLYKSKAVLGKKLFFVYIF